MHPILPHLWFNTEAREATAFYVSLFPNSSIKHISTITDTPSGTCDIVSFSLAGQECMAISAGPFFTFNPSVSLFVVCATEEEIDAAWNALAEGGKVLMPYSTYPWAKKYGWVQDRFGLSWQLSLSDQHDMTQRVTPALMFTQSVAGKAREAIQTYTELFPESSIDLIVPYEAGEGDTEGFLKHARFTLQGSAFIAMDSSGPHAFQFNEAFSFVVSCDTQEEIDRYWETLSAVPEAERCGWLKDAYGVSWQIVPSIMNTMMTTGTQEQIARVTQAFLKMKKFDIKALEEAYGR